MFCEFLLWILCILLGLDGTLFVWLCNCVKKEGFFYYQLCKTPMPNHDEFTEQQLWCTDPWTCSSSLISQFLPLLPDNLFSKQKQSDWCFSSGKQFLFSTSTQDPPMGFHHIHNKPKLLLWLQFFLTKGPAYLPRVLSFFPFILLQPPAPKQQWELKFPFLCKHRDLVLTIHLTNNIHARLFCKYRI